MRKHTSLTRRLSVSFLIAILALVLMGAQSCAPKTGAAALPGGDPNASGGVYGLVNQQGEVVYVGKTVDFAQRFAMWQERLPKLSGRVLIRIDDLNIQAGAEQYLWQRVRQLAVQYRYTDQMWQRPPMNMYTSNPQKLRFYRRLLQEGKDFVDSHGLSGYDVRNYGKFANVKDFTVTEENLGPYAPDAVLPPSDSLGG